MEEILCCTILRDNASVTDDVMYNKEYGILKYEFQLSEDTKRTVINVPSENPCGLNIEIDEIYDKTGNISKSFYAIDRVVKRKEEYEQLISSLPKLQNNEKLTEVELRTRLLNSDLNVSIADVCSWVENDEKWRARKEIERLMKIKEDIAEHKKLPVIRKLWKAITEPFKKKTEAEIEADKARALYSNKEDVLNKNIEKATQKFLEMEGYVRMQAEINYYQARENYKGNMQVKKPLDSKIHETLEY